MSGRDGVSRLTPRLPTCRAESAGRDSAMGAAPPGRVLLRGVPADWTPGHHYQGLRGTLARHYCPEDLYIANLLRILDGLQAGATTTLDWYHNIKSPGHAESAVDALRATGLRVVFGCGTGEGTRVPADFCSTGAPTCHPRRCTFLRTRRQGWEHRRRK